MERKENALALNLRLPHEVGVAARTSVQVVGEVVYLELIDLALDLQVSKFYAVGNTANGLATSGAVTDIILAMLVAQQHIVEGSVSVGKADSANCGSDICQAHLCATVVCQSVEQNLLSRWSYAPILNLYHSFRSLKCLSSCDAEVALLLIHIVREYHLGCGLSHLLEVGGHGCQTTQQNLAQVGLVIGYNAYILDYL